MAKLILVGAGTIGLPLIKRLLAEGHELCVLTRTQPDLNSLPSGAKVKAVKAPVDVSYVGAIDAALDAYCHDADAGFIVIPTGKDNGTIALAYALYFWSKGMLVISAEKGTSAYHFDKIRAHLDSFGGWATVGGGALIIPKTQLHHLRGRKLSVHGVFNATLNYIFTGVREGRALQTVCEEAADLGYAEPSEKIDPVTIVNGEINDVRLKICAFYNHVLAPDGGPYLKPEQFVESRKIDWADLQRLTDYNRRCRYIVRISNDGSNHDGHGGSGWLHAKLTDWDFDARFIDLTRGSPLDDFLPNGVDNCIKVQDVVTGSGPYREMGPGAGKTPTVDALVSNFYELSAKRGMTLGDAVRSLPFQDLPKLELKGGPQGRGIAEARTPLADTELPGSFLNDGESFGRTA